MEENDKRLLHFQTGRGMGLTLNGNNIRFEGSYYVVYAVQYILQESIFLKWLSFQSIVKVKLF